MKKNPMCVTSTSKLQQEWTVTVFTVCLVTVTHLLLTQQHKRLRRDQMSAAEKNAGRLQLSTPGQDLQKHMQE